MAKVSASTSTEQKEPDPGPVDADTAHETGEVVLSQWEFIGRIPTEADVLALLKTLRPVWGINTWEFADYVQPLPQSKKIHKVNDRGQKYVESIDCYVLYMSVAGRIKMLEAAADENGWEVDYEPEPVTPTGAPGYISLETRIVYREYVVVKIRSNDSDSRPLGRKPGTAWVPYSGGSNAAASNPYEKVETSARGRAIAAWGFGVFPGSGVASLEEMQGARANALGMEVEQATAGNGRQTRGSGQQRLSREELEEQCFALAEELRQARGMTDEEMHARIVGFLTSNLGIRNAVSADGIVDWTKVKDAQMTLLTNSLRQSLQTFRDEGSQV